MEYILMRCWNL